MEEIFSKEDDSYCTDDMHVLEFDQDEVIDYINSNFSLEGKLTYTLVRGSKGSANIDIDSSSIYPPRKKVCEFTIPKIESEAPMFTFIKFLKFLLKKKIVEVENQNSMLRKLFSNLTEANARSFFVENFMKITHLDLSINELKGLIKESFFALEDTYGPIDLDLTNLHDLIAEKAIKDVKTFAISGLVVVDKLQSDNQKLNDYLKFVVIKTLEKIPKENNQRENENAVFELYKNFREPKFIQAYNEQKLKEMNIAVDFST